MRTVTKLPNRLSPAVHQPGGITLTEAVKAADAKLEAIRDDVTSKVNDTADRILKLGFELLAARDDAAADTLYALSNTVAGTAGVFGMGTLGEIAFSLCELLDRLKTSGQWDAPALQVHLNSFRLLRSGAHLTEAQQKSIVAALAQVVRRT